MVRNPSPLPESRFGKCPDELAAYVFEDFILLKQYVAGPGTQCTPHVRGAVDIHDHGASAGYQDAVNLIEGPDLEIK